MSPGHQRTRQLLGILSLTLWALALPAQGLGNLVDEVVDQLPELPVTTTITVPTITVPTSIPIPTTVPVTTVPVAQSEAPVVSAPIVTSPTTTAAAPGTSIAPVPALGVQAATVSSTQSAAPDRSIEIDLLDTVDTSPSVALATPPTSWLAFLSEWLSIESIGEVLAIPFRLLNLLFRALTSAGSGLVAPASLLLTLAVGARSRLRPTAA